MQLSTHRHILEGTGLCFLLHIQKLAAFPAKYVSINQAIEIKIIEDFVAA